jgi:hypothetical protein
MSNYKEQRRMNRNGEKGKEGRKKQGNLSIPFLFRDSPCVEKVPGG